ncbi:hypothetical protein Droror1_Dr00028027 [Drosera rotundifolia]
MTFLPSLSWKSAAAPETPLLAEFFLGCGCPAAGSEMRGKKMSCSCSFIFETYGNLQELAAVFSMMKFKFSCGWYSFWVREFWSKQEGIGAERLAAPFCPGLAQMRGKKENPMAAAF